MCALLQESNNKTYHEVVMSSDQLFGLALKALGAARETKDLELKTRNNNDQQPKQND
jgi:hypothetical protein